MREGSDFIAHEKTVFTSWFQNGWSADEMFKTNQEKFGVTSTYNDDLHQYTLVL